MGDRTKKYGLTVWGREDEFKSPEGLNGNFEAVEEALAGLQGQLDGVGYVLGSYAGNGSYPRDIELGFYPKGVLLFNRDGRTGGSSTMGGLFSRENDLMAGDNHYALITETGFRLGASNTNSASYTYVYIAFR